MNDQVKSAFRVLNILEALTVSPDAMTLSELAHQLDLPKSSASALLKTLVMRGYVERQENAYRLRPQLRLTGWPGGDMALLMKFAPPAMEKAVTETRESAFLGILTAEKTIRYVYKVVSPQEVRYDGSLLHDRPAYCTSIGRIFLASLPESQLTAYLRNTPLRKITSTTVTDPNELQAILDRVRRTGYAESRNGHVEGASGVAAGILNERHQLVGAITLAAPTDRFDREHDVLVSAVRQAADEVTGGFGPATPISPTLPSFQTSAEPQDEP